MRLKVKEHDGEGQVGFLGILQKVAGQCTVVKTFSSAPRASGNEEELGRYWFWAQRNKFNLAVHTCNLQ